MLGFVLLLTFYLSGLLAILLHRYASKLKLIDKPNGRSMHSSPKPRGGGIAIILSVLCIFVIFYTDLFIENINLFISVCIILLTGIIDDIMNIKVKIKFILIIIATILLFFMTDFKIVHLGIWFGHDINLPLLASLTITIFAVAGFTNAFNLIDGIDGLSSGIAIVIFSFFYYIAFIHHDKIVEVFSMLMIASLLAFKLFNWYPSKIFMGDSGSLSIGFIIAILAIKISNYISISSILFLTALPLLDTITVMIRRIRNGISPFKADKKHLHHKLLSKLEKVPLTSTILILSQFILSSIGLLLSHSPNYIITGLFIFVLFAVYILSSSKLVNSQLHKPLQ